MQLLTKQTTMKITNLISKIHKQNSELLKEYGQAYDQQKKSLPK